MDLPSERSELRTRVNLTGKKTNNNVFTEKGTCSKKLRQSVIVYKREHG